MDDVVNAFLVKLYTRTHTLGHIVLSQSLPRGLRSVPLHAHLREGQSLLPRHAFLTDPQSSE